MAEPVHNRADDTRTISACTRGRSDPTDACLRKALKETLRWFARHPNATPNAGDFEMRSPDESKVPHF